MRLAELSRRSRVPIPTIKYYLRRGLLPPGDAQSSTWAAYDEAHVRRLALLRALTEVGGLSLDQVRRVVDVVDDDRATLHETLGTAQWLLSPPPEGSPSDASLAQVDALLARHDWRLEEGSPHRARLAAALDRLADLGHPADDARLDDYLVQMSALATREVGSLPAGDRAGSAERLVVGTVLQEPVLLSLRRMAHEVLSGRRGP